MNNHLYWKFVAHLGLLFRGKFSFAPFNLKMFSRVDIPDWEAGEAGLGTLPGPRGRDTEAPPKGRLQGWSTRLSHFTYFQIIKKKWNDWDPCFCYNNWRYLDSWGLGASCATFYLWIPGPEADQVIWIFNFVLVCLVSVF